MGWIKLDRKILQTDLWLDSEPFCRRAAWVDLILQANHEARDVSFGNVTVRVERGSLITSQEKLARRWNWSRKKVVAWLASLTAAGMVTTSVRANRWTCITLVKYAFYQGTTEDTTEDTTKDTTKDTTQTPTTSGFEPLLGTTEDTTKGTTKGTTEDTRTRNKEYKNSRIYIMQQCAREEENPLGGVNAIDRRPPQQGVNAIDPVDTTPGVNAIGLGEEEKDLAWAVKLYESKLGTFARSTAERIAALLEEVGPEVYERAVNRAYENRAPRIRYVETVAKGLAAGVDYKATAAKSGDVWGNAFSEYMGGVEHGEDNQG